MQVDKWRSKQPDQPSRSEAIRRLVRMALAPSPTDPQRDQANHLGRPADRETAGARTLEIDDDGDHDGLG